MALAGDSMVRLALDRVASGGPDSDDAAQRGIIRTPIRSWLVRRGFHACLVLGRERSGRGISTRRAGIFARRARPVLHPRLPVHQHADPAWLQLRIVDVLPMLVLRTDLVPVVRYLVTARHGAIDRDVVERDQRAVGQQFAIRLEIAAHAGVAMVRVDEQRIDPPLAEQGLQQA